MAYVKRKKLIAGILAASMTITGLYVWGVDNIIVEANVVCNGNMEYIYRTEKLTAFSTEKSTAPTATKRPSATATPKVTERPDITDAVKETSAPKETETPEAASTPKVTETPKETVTDNPSTTAAPEETQKPQSGTNLPSTSVDNSGTSGNFAIASFTSNKAAPQEAGSHIVLTLKGTGGSGKYTYKFYIVNTETLYQELYTGWANTNTVTWIPSEGGRYQIRAYICDDGSGGKEIRNVTVDYEITSALTVKTFKATKLSRRKVKFTMKAEGEEPMKYKLMIVDAAGKKTTVKKYSTVRTKIYTFKKAGTYTIYLYVKDGMNKVKKVKKVLQMK